MRRAAIVMAAEGGEERAPAQASCRRHGTRAADKLSAWGRQDRPRVDVEAMAPGRKRNGEVKMRVMVIVKANEESEAGALPQPEMLEAMGAYNNELIAAGVMLDGAGLKASAEGARVSLRNGKAVVTDGPFAETKELIAGYWVWQVKSLQDAIDWAKKAPTEGDHAFNLEIRPFFEPEDFAGVASEEMIAQEQGWRAEQAKQAPKASA
jgi:hypothetical protein